ncbi:uncharacterized protein HMPREF1541_04870 [Cyphellophora europaea CBS 101466]|uniref:SH3 domain-containing protein n=1 Tax=Cyphellophora europaea (strain CBS 101466) TaxID=1220924 RepID=W2RXU1_CYPE1|nr:uncharacterized protein HMPREF1541_04870 [Cyphellophora europaea CBS 101466]ETN40593.1 hypothetical protein HMPREF1541_04870 [Cyphellophora europaea CBS 101466]
MQSVQRQFGKYMKRSADEKTISVLLKDFEEADHLLTRIIDSSKAWKEAWIAILTHQTRIFTELESLYQPILGAGADYHGHTAVETDPETLARTSRYMSESEELKRDLSEDVGQVDTRMIHVAQSARESLRFLRKTIKKREDRKLDFERYQGRVDNTKSKTKLSDRDRATLTKAETELLQATDAYNNADEHLRQVLPPVLAAVFSLLPHILAAQIEIQNSLLGHYYTSVHTYCSQEGFPNPAPPMDEVIRSWSDAFLPVQKEVESLCLIASGKAVRLPMSQSERPNGYPTNGQRRPSAHSTLSNRGHSPSPARKLPPSPEYETKSKVSPTPSPSANFLLSPTEQTPLSASPASSSVYQTPGVASFSPAGPNTDYFSRDRQPSSATQTLATPSSMSSLASATSTLAIGKKKPPPPPPPPRQNSQNWVFVTALYDFGGQGEGDLVFREGDRIRVIKQTESKDDWWQGELRGVKGAFPANYCE